MDKEKTLVKNTTIVTIGKICTQLISFFLLPLYTAYLSTEEYGIVDLLNTLISLLIPIVTFQLDQGIFRFLIDCREDDEKRKKIITSVVFFIIKQTIIYFIIFIIASRWIQNEYKYFLATNLLASTFSTILLQITRGLGDNPRYAVGSFISGSSIVILNVIFIVGFKLGAYGMLYASLIGNILCIIYLFFSKKLYKYISRRNNDKVILKDILKYSIPLIPNMISWWVVSASDRLIITYFKSVAENGIYSAGNKFSGIITSLYSIFNLTWTESASLNIDAEDKDEFFNKVLDFTIRFFGFLCLGIIAFMPFVFSIMVNEKFGDAYYQIPILMVGAVFNILVSFIGSIYVAKKKSKDIAKTSIFAAIINIVINVALIKWIGLYAASLSTAVAYASMFFYRYFDAKKYVNLKINKKAVSVIVLLYILTFTTYYIDNLYLNIAIAAVVAIFAVVMNLNTIKAIPEMAKSFIKKKVK